jgi:4-diphosphocytidyl-2-C-methyl-D-erythritol kinase
LNVALPARAKLNLDLKVTGKREDGLHELRTHMVAIELHDLLEVEPAARTELEVSGLPGAGADRNTVLAAHAALEQAAGRPLPARFRLHKRIPAGAGLGGASSDAAATLRALKALHSLTIDLAPLAAQVGADVTFFLTGGTALVEGIGERITPGEVEAAWFAIAWPGIELSTPLVYRAWDEVGGEGTNGLRRAAARVDPGIDGFADALGESWQMTGSGSAFFRRCPDRASAEAAARTIRCWTTVTRSVGAWA